MRALAIRRGDEPGQLIGTILCHDVRPAFRKGHLLRAEDIPALVAASWTELHVIEPGPGDISQREAGERLARILSSAGMQVAPAGHRHVLKAEHDGMLRIDAPALQRLNSIEGIAVFTLMNDTVVSAGQVVAEAQITPLAIDGQAIEQAAREREVVRILSFTPREVVILTRDDSVLRALTAKLGWFGCTIREIVTLPADAPSIRELIARHESKPVIPSVSEGPGRLGGAQRTPGPLFIVNGSNALDPLDPIFVALEEMGARMQRVGMPVHPGTLLWIASWKSATIIGLPSCGLGPQVTAFDLILPKLLAEGTIEDVSALGHGGILTHTRSRMLTMEPVDEPVR